jgi:hypothetical protein
MKTQQLDWTDSNAVIAHRARARSLLPQIMEQVKQSLDEAGIGLDVFVMIPSSGDAVATFGTVIDPPDAVWGRVGDIVCSIVGKAVGLGRVSRRELACATTADRRSIDSADPTSVAQPIPNATAA